MGSIFPEVVAGTIYRSNTYTSFVVSEEVEGIAAGHTNSEISIAYYLSVAVEVRTLEYTTSCIVIPKHTGKGGN